MAGREPMGPSPCHSIRLRRTEPLASLAHSRDNVPCTTVEFLPFGLDWIHVAEIRFSGNKGLPNNNDPPRQQKVRNSTVELAAPPWPRPETRLRWGAHS